MQYPILIEENKKVLQSSKVIFRPLHHLDLVLERRLKKVLAPNQEIALRRIHLYRHRKFSIIRLPHQR